MATAFSNTGLSQLGQDMNFSGISGEGKGLGQFLLGAALSNLGAPKELTSFLSNKPIAPPKTSMDQGSISNAVVPGQPMQNPEDERMSFSQGFGNLFSHLPTFGKK